MRRLMVFFTCLILLVGFVELSVAAENDKEFFEQEKQAYALSQIPTSKDFAKSGVSALKGECAFNKNRDYLKEENFLALEIVSDGSEFISRFAVGPIGWIDDRLNINYSLAEMSWHVENEKALYTSGQQYVYDKSVSYWLRSDAEFFRVHYEHSNGLEGFCHFSKK